MGKCQASGTVAWSLLWEVTLRWLRGRKHRSCSSLLWIKAIKMADKEDEAAEDNCENGWCEASSSESEESDNPGNDSTIPSIPPIEPQENGEDASAAIELFLEQVAAVTTSNNSDEHSRVKDKERDVKRASRMAIPPECKCHLNNGQPCHTRFSVAELMDTRMHYMTISKKELDIAVLAKLECGIHLSRMTTRKKRKPTERKKHRTDFYHHGYRICNLMFVYLHGFSYKKLKALVAQYKTNGVKTRIHKNLKPKPELEEKKPKKKKTKAKPKPKMPKKARVLNTKDSRKTLEQKKDRNPHAHHFVNLSQHKSLGQPPQPPPPAPPAPPPPQPPTVPVTFPMVSQNNHPHPPTFPIATKHNPPPTFAHSAAGYSSTPMFSHHPLPAGHPHHHHDYPNQRGMINPPLDFSNQRASHTNFPVFPGSNPQCVTYSVVHSVNF